MSRMSEILIDIQEMYYDGLDARTIAERLGLPIEMMVEVITRYSGEWNEEYDDPGQMDGDHESALASAGWGTDEDYGYYGA